MDLVAIQVQVIKFLLFSELDYHSFVTSGGALCRALRRKDATAVVKLIVEVSTFDDCTSIDAHYLRKALDERRHFDVVTHLINCRKFDLQYQDGDGNNLLHTVCILYARGMKLYKNYFRLKHEEASTSSRLKETIEYLIEKCQCDPQIRNCKGALPLHIACCSELVPVEVVELLSNCDVNTGLSSSWKLDYSLELDQGDTPLHIACLNESEEIVKYLIEKCHCNPCITNSKGALALHIVCAVGSLSMVRLVSNCDVNTGLSSSWDLNERAKLVQGDTPLHIACLRGSEEIVKYLIEKCCCDPQIEDSNGVLPLHIACAYNSLSIVKLVSNCDVNAAVKKSYKTQGRMIDIPLLSSYEREFHSIGLTAHETPLHIACLRNEEMIVKYLIETCHCDPQIEDSNGILPLHIACAYNSLSIVKLVSNCDVNAAVKKSYKTQGRCSFLSSYEREFHSLELAAGETPLHIACLRGSEEIMKYLIETCHCDPQIEDSNGVLPLHIACAYNSLSMVKLVSNCDVNAAVKKSYKSQGRIINIPFLSSYEREFHSIELAAGETPLHIACLRGSEEIVKYLIETCHCDPQMEDSNGVLPLHIACAYNSLSMVKLVSNCDVNAAVKKSYKPQGRIINIPFLSSYEREFYSIELAAGETPLHIACLRGSEEIVTYLIETCHCNPQMEDSNGVIPLHIACAYYNSLSMVKLVSNCDVNAAVKKSCKSQGRMINIPFLSSYEREFHSIELAAGETPLHIACLRGSEEIVKYLIETCHCDPQMEDSNGVLPLHIACAYNSLSMVKLVSNCDVNAAVKKSYKTQGRMIDIALLSSYELEFYSLELAAGETPLHIACLKGGEEMVKHLIVKCHCNPHITNSKGALPLHIACAAGRSLDIVRLVSNCDVNTGLSSSLERMKLVKGDTPLHIACSEGSEEIVEYLIVNCHCDPRITNCKGALPLHAACATSSLVTVRLVSNCDVNTGLSSLWELKRMKLVEGDTPLHIACLKGSEEIVEYLIKKCHCDPRITNCKGALPLHCACTTSSLATVRLVCNCNVNTGLSSLWELGEIVKIVQGETPLHIACLKGSEEIVKYLVETCHCDPQIEDFNGILPLHIACANNSLNIVKLVSNCDVNTAVKSSFKFQHKQYKMIEVEDIPLQIAIKCWGLYQKFDILMYLLREKQCKVWNRHNRDNVIVRYLMKGYGDVEICSALRHIASCLRDYQDEDGNTILHIACRPCVEVSESLLVVKCLIEEKYCSPCVQNNEGELPLHVACSHKALEIVKLVSNCDTSSKTKITGDSPLHIACKNSTAEVVKYLIEQHRCDPAALNNSHESCLESAVMNGQPDERVEIIKYIVEMDLLGQSHQHERCRTIINIPNDNGQLAIHIACQQSSLDVVELISNYTNDINATAQKSGDTPLHIACRKQTTRFVKYLIENKQCNPNIPNNNGELPLHIACREQATEIAKIVSNCDADFTTKLGNTPLHEACGASKTFIFPNKSLEIIRHLVSHKKCKVNVKNKEGKTAIHYACKAQSVELVNYLLLDGKADLSLTDNEGQTSLMFATNSALIKVLLDHGADPRPLYKTFAQYFRDHSSDNPPPTPQKILVVGNAGAGKTSLIQSLENEGQKSNEHSEPQPTAGIIPTNFQSDIYGPVIWYDCAGQREYYASHEAILHNLIAVSSPIILLVVDISKNETNVRHDLLYWLSFIKAQCTSTQNKPHLIVIGSHADMLRKEDIDRNYWKLQQVIGNIKFVGEIPMDCRQSKSSGIDQLQKRLKSSSHQLRTDTVLGFTCHCFYIFLLDRFQTQPAITVQQIMDAIYEAATVEDADEWDYVVNSESASSSDDNDAMSDADDQENYQENDIIQLLPEKGEAIRFCEELNDRGHIILVKDPHQPELSWVILNKEEILSSVNGTVFAPLEFTEHKMLASSTGVVPFSKLVTHFPNTNLNMLIEFLSQLEFCREIKDQEILNLIYKENAMETNKLERYFFFPGLVSVERPEGVWRLNERFNYKCGFIFHCLETDQFFTPRFLQVLILRLAFSVAFTPPTRSVGPTIERLCCVWKNGISWINENGIESVIEVLEDSQTVAVMLRCINGEENEAECIIHRSSVIHTVWNTKADICPHISTTEFFIHPSYVQYPLRVCNGIPLFSLAAIARAVTNLNPCIISDCGKNRCIEFIKVEELLCFEPFSDSGKKVIQEMFEDDNCSKEVSDDFFHSMTDSIAHQKLTQKTEWLKKLFKLPLSQLQEQTSQVPEGPTREWIGLFQTWRQCTAGTYQCLRETFDKFSIFCGRNPLDLGAAQSQADGTVHEKFLGNHSESAVASQQQSEIQADMPRTQTGQAQNESVSSSGISFSSFPQGLGTGAFPYGYPPMNVSPAHPSGVFTFPPNHPSFPTQPQAWYPVPSYPSVPVPPWCPTPPPMQGYPHPQTRSTVAYSSSSSCQVKGVSDVTKQQEALIYGERPSKRDLQCLKWRNGNKEERFRLMDFLAPDWRNVGIALGLEVHLDSIETACLKDPKRCIEKLFGEWLTRNSDCSWNRLISALDDAGICSDHLKTALASKVDQ